MEWSTIPRKRTSTSHHKLLSTNKKPRTHVNDNQGHTGHDVCLSFKVTQDMMCLSFKVTQDIYLSFKVTQNIMCVCLSRSDRTLCLFVFQGHTGHYVC